MVCEEDIQLTESQMAGVQLCCETARTRTGIIRFGGFAGTGKTTCARSIVKQVSGAIPCAYTGKATYRLVEKGITGARTIHSTIYIYEPTTHKFYLRDEVPGDYFLIDEGSMVGQKIWDDVQSFRKPIIVIGDPAQLQPVNDFDPQLMVNPNYLLTEVHRQAMLSGIIQYATKIRMSKRIRRDEEFKDVTRKFGPRARLATNDELMEHDIILCGFNRKRNLTNTRCRKLLGRTGLIAKNEKIICLKNDRELNVYNGQILTLDEVVDRGKDAKTLKVACHDILGTNYHVPVMRSQFNKPELPEQKELRNGVVYADYAYAITVHKSQGSEWDKVLVINEHGSNWNQRRWLYTAVTRAAKELTILSRE